MWKKQIEPFLCRDIIAARRKKKLMQCFAVGEQVSHA